MAKISLNEHEGGITAYVVDPHTDIHTPLVTRRDRTPSEVCQLATAKLQQLADRFDRLRRSPFPFRGGTQDTINREQDETPDRHAAGTRLTAEADRDALNEKIAALSQYMLTEDFERRSRRTQTAFELQLQCMGAYRNALNRRLR